MSVIRRLGERVEKEHDQFLRDAQRIEDRSALAVNGSNTQSFGTVDFENLIGSSGGITVKADTMTENKSWEDNVWGSIFDDNVGPIICSHFTFRLIIHVSHLRILLH
jgi:SCY1-like protein 2